MRFAESLKSHPLMLLIAITVIGFLVGTGAGLAVLRLHAANSDVLVESGISAAKDISDAALWYLLIGAVSGIASAFFIGLLVYPKLRDGDSNPIH